MNIILLVGGYSSERYVSKLSSKCIFDALNNLGHRVTLLDPAYGDNQTKDTEKYFSKTDFAEISTSNYIKCFNRKEFDFANLVFIGLHGKWGEDGTVQAILDMKGIKYTGSKTFASAIAMDKTISKRLFDEYGIPTPQWLSFRYGEMTVEDIISKIETELDYPTVIKPGDQGSTIGLSICKNRTEIKNAILLAKKYSKNILVEKFIKGRELTVGIIGDKILPILEIIPKKEIYDYECKYTPGMSEYVVPANLPLHMTKKLQNLSLQAFKALGCEGYGRLDFRLSKDNKFYLLEINTLPGMTKTSLLPKMASAMGISFDELIDRIIKLSV